MTMGKLSRRYLGFLPTWGIGLNGRYLTAVSSGFLKTVKGSSLSALIPRATRTPLRYLKRNQRNIHGDYSFTVDVGDTGGVMVNGKKRKLTIEEKEQLQGFPVGWTEGVPIRQRHKMMGNAVTTNVISEIGKLFEEKAKEGEV
jgi:site-specific DNA-cytosine methylase